MMGNLACLRCVLATIVVGVLLLSCQADKDAPGATRSEPAHTVSSSPTAPSNGQEHADNDVESVFRDVEGFSFENASVRTRRSLRSLFDRHAEAPVVDLAVKRVFRNGTLVPAEVVVARFAVKQSERKEFFNGLLLEIAKTYDDAQPILNGLGIRFVNPEQEAVAYPGVYGDLVYVLSPQSNTAVRVAKALVEAEPR